MEFYYEDKNWAQSYDAYIKKFKGSRAKHTKHLSFHRFGMNWGIWHHDLSSDFYAFENLESIDLSYNYIDTVIIDFSLMPKLKKIDFSHNALYYWGQEGSFRIHEQFAAPNLEELDLSYGICGHIIIGQKAPFLHSLRWLDLSGNHFTTHGGHDKEKPPVLRLPKFEVLSYLGLRDNYYTYIPKLRYLNTLRSLDLSGNPLRSNFDELERMPWLETLNLSACGLTKIPKPLFRLTNLKTLVLTGNAIEAEELGRLELALLNCKVI